MHARMHVTFMMVWVSGCRPHEHNDQFYGIPSNDFSVLALNSALLCCVFNRTKCNEPCQAIHIMVKHNIFADAFNRSRSKV